MDSRGSLFTYLRRPSKARLARLVRDHHQFVWTVAMRITGNREDAADVCQDVFLKAFRSLAKLKDPERFPAWLYSIAQNTLKDHLRRKRRRTGQVILSEKLDELQAAYEKEPLPAY